MKKSMLKRLEELCNSLCLRNDVGLKEFGGEKDHVHLLLSMHPNVMPSGFINTLKTVTSRLIRKEFAQSLKRHFKKRVLWTRAYCLLTTGGAPLSVIKEYIENQGKKPFIAN